MNDWNHLADDGRQRGSSLLRWLAESARSALLLRPRLDGLQASPALLALLAALLVGLGVALQRVAVAGPAMFYGQAITSGWLTTVLVLWACWIVARSNPASPGAATLFGVLLAQQLLISMPLWALQLLALHAGAPSISGWAARIQTGFSFFVVGWVALAGVVLLLRHTTGSVALRAGVFVVFALTVAADILAPSAQFWYADENAAHAAEEAEEPRLKLTQETLEAQSSAVIANLNALQPQRPGVIDVYAITFAPYAGEEVFRRESNVVADLMRTRFDAQGHVIQLINHPQTARDLPWATALNLQRAIQRVASLMDPDEDILFIHLTSHGARNGQLAASFWPIDVDPITPAQLRSWLDQAGVRFRVLSISACFAGAWVPALAEPGTLVMTASDADHTSFGCGSRSELTFFGRAMYAEELRHTHSFEQAHANARLVIDRREKEAGKTDGYSNPQIAVGDAIRPKLAALQARLDASSP